MSCCGLCEELVGKSPLRDPHAALKPLSGRKLPNAWQEYYVCNDCGTRLQRIAPSPGYEKTYADPWTLVR